MLARRSAEHVRLELLYGIARRRFREGSYNIGVLYNIGPICYTCNLNFQKVTDLCTRDSLICDEIT